MLLAADTDGVEYPAEVLVLPLALALLGDADELLEVFWLDGTEYPPLLVAELETP